MGGTLDGADTKKHSRSAKANCAGGAFHALENSGAGSGLYDLTQMAGANNLADDIGIRSMQVDSEWVLERNPQCFVKSILLGKRNAEEDTRRTDECLRSVLERDNWQLLDAVKENRVYILDSDIASGPRYLGRPRRACSMVVS